MSSKKYSSVNRHGLQKFRVPSGVTPLVVKKFLQSLDCPRALTVWLLYESGEHEQLAKLEFNPMDYANAFHLRDSYQATKYLSKAEFLQLPYDKESVALAKFQEFETLCYETNKRFRNLSRDPLYTGSCVWLHHAVTRKIAKILGDFSFDEFLLTPDWGPGASTLIKRRDASPVKKFHCESGITRDLHQLCLSLNLLSNYPLWQKRLSGNGFPVFQVGNKVVTVPKDATTDRVIAIEPGINLWFQMSIGKMIGRRLRRYGVDLRYQSRNQQLARQASKDGYLATVDLSSASDSISYEVVRELLPPDWFEVLDAVRSHYGSQDTRVVKWEKFSSMGNGFTFQLETLIFYAIASCICERSHISNKDVSVYGDDILLPSRCFDTLVEVMSFYGFRVNKKKSHFCGSFRESCGVHYFDGIDVKPVYQRDKLSSIQSIYRLANAVRRLAHRRTSGLGCDSAFYELHHYLVHLVPKALRLRIPDRLGDGGFISNFDEALPARCRDGIEGYRVQHLVDVSLTHIDETEGYLINSLWQLEKSSVSILLSSLSEDGGAHTMLEVPTQTEAILSGQGRNSVQYSGRTTPRLRRSIVDRWDDLGPWF